MYTYTNRTKSNSAPCVYCILTCHLIKLIIFQFTLVYKLMLLISHEHKECQPTLRLMVAYVTCTCEECVLNDFKSILYWDAESSVLLQQQMQMVLNMVGRRNFRLSEFRPFHKCLLCDENITLIFFRY